MKSKLSSAKKSKTTTFSPVFLPKKIDNFLGKSKLNFWTKNEDFEQCVRQYLVNDFGKINEERESLKNYLRHHFDFENLLDDIKVDMYFRSTSVLF